MTNEELDALRAMSITDRCWAFNAMPEVRGWTISRRADYLHMHLDVQKQKWSRQVRQFGGLAKVDPGCFYAASCSVISAVA